MTQCFMRDCQLLDTHLEPTCAWKKVQLRAQPAADECEHGHALPTQDSETCFVFTSCKEAMAHGWMYATWNWQSRDMTCKPSEWYRKVQLTATSIMFPCSHHACICIAVLSSWTSGLRCKGNWHKNKKSFQQTCISMNEIITCCFSKKSAQSCNTVHFLWQCEGNENVNSCNIIKHLRSRTCKSRHSTQDLLAIHVTFSSLSVRTPQPKKNKFDFSKTMFANEIVSFTISSISKSPTCGFVFVITC